MGRVRCTSSPFRSKNGCGATVALAPPEQVFESDSAAPGPVSRGRALVAEDGAEEVREVAAARLPAVLSPKPAARAARSRPLGVVLPVRSEGVVSLALLGIGEHFVGFGDFLEAFRGVLTFGDVRMVLPCEPPVGGLDRL